MKTVNVRELRETIATLKQALAKEGELLLVSNDEPVARLIPVEPRRRRPPALKVFRDRQPMLAPGAIERWIRDGRDAW
jgi:antitoxin (DNA-binding transcriptional repressor) of toxin-antitoxin stability system